jgi:hypothetical protein
MAHVQRAIPVARALARQIVDDLIAPHRMDPFRGRHADLAELVRLRGNQAYAREPLVAEVLVRATLGRWHDDGGRHSVMLGLVLELLSGRETRCSPRFSETGNRSPHTPLR